jgi:hypothetical protein
VKPTRLVALLVVCLAVCAFQSRAPKGDGTRLLTGVVTDQDGRPIAHAAVQIEDEKTLQVRSYISEANGEFHFAMLSPDVDYEVSAEFDGIRSTKKTLSQFDSRSKPKMTLVIRIPK